MSEKEQIQDKQIQELRKWCGWKLVKQKRIINPDTDREFLELSHWVDPEGDEWGTDKPIELNELFKWAVPKPLDLNPDVRKIQSITFDFGRCSIIDIEGKEYFGENKDPALALFQAIYQVIKESKQ